MKQVFLLICYWVLCPPTDAQRTIAPNDPVYFSKSYILAKEQFYLLSVKRATAHYYQFYNESAKEKQARQIIRVTIYPDSLVSDTNLLIDQLHIEKYRKGYLAEELRVKYQRPDRNSTIRHFDTLDWKLYTYADRKRTVSVLNKLYGTPDNYADSLRTFYFNRRKRLVRTLTSNESSRQTDTRFAYNRQGKLAQVSSVELSGQVPLAEKRWELRYAKHRTGTTLPQKILDSAASIPALDFVGQQLGGPPAASDKIVVQRFEKLPQKEKFTATGADSVCINRKGGYQFVLSIDQSDTAVQVRKIKGRQAVQRVYLELGRDDERRRVFRYTTRQITGGSIVYENNFRGKAISGSCSLDIERTVISDAEDATVSFYRVLR